jgi:hypothetical protein
MVTGTIYGPVEIEILDRSQSFVGALWFQHGSQVSRQVRVLDWALEQKRLSSTITMNPPSASSSKIRSATVLEHGISA